MQWAVGKQTRSSGTGCHRAYEEGGPACHAAASTSFHTAAYPVKANVGNWFGAQWERNPSGICYAEVGSEFFSFHFSILLPILAAALALAIFHPSLSATSPWSLDAG